MMPKVTLVPTQTTQTMQTGVVRIKGDAECYLTGREAAGKLSVNDGGAISNNASRRRKSSSSADSTKNGGAAAAGGDDSSTTGCMQSFSSGASEHLIYHGDSGRAPWSPLHAAVAELSARAMVRLSGVRRCNGESSY